MDQNQTQLLTPEQVAARLQIKRATVYRMVKRGQLPAARIAGQIRFSPAAVEKFIADSTIPFLDMLSTPPAMASGEQSTPATPAVAANNNTPDAGPADERKVQT